MTRPNRKRQHSFGRFARRLAAERLEPRLALDGQLAELLPRFGSPESLREYLLADAIDQYSSLFGQPVGYHCWEVCYYSVALELQRSEAMWASDTLAGSAGGSLHVSSTNVQVAGVDEGDIIEADEGHLYVLGGRQLAIVDADAAGGVEIATRVDLPGRGVAEFLFGDRLTVISTESFWGEPQPLMSLASSGGLRPLPFVAARDSVTITVFDITDRAAPRITEQTSLDGSYRDSRAIDDKIIVIVANANLTLPPPQQICKSDDTPLEWPPPVSDTKDLVGANRLSGPMDSLWAGPGWGMPGLADCVYETRIDWQPRIESQLDALIAEQLPHFTSYGADNQFARAGLLHEAADLVRPVSQHPSQILSVVTFDVNDDDAGVLAAEGIVTGWAGNVYASRDAIIVSEPVWNEGTVVDGGTRLLLYRWDAATGSPYAAAVGVVPGALLNSFALDEYQGTVRVATTTTEFFPEDARWESSNHLFVLETVGTKMEVIGQLNDFGVDERIQSVRFLGDTAFVVTFRQIDPLFTVDLSTPSQPRLVGELEMPGFSGYLQLLDETHLLGIGYGPNAMNEWVPRLALFDVADLAHPRLLGEYFLPVWSSSLASWDHHALQWNAHDQILTMPVEWSEQGELFSAEDGTSWPAYRQASALFVWHVGIESSASPANPFQFLGEIRHDTSVQRSATIGQHLYSLSYADLKVVDLDAIDSVLDTLNLFIWPEPTPPWTWWNFDPSFTGLRAWDETPENSTPPDVTPSPLDDKGLHEVLTAAVQHLADRLDIDVPQVRLISAEPLPVPQDAQGEASATGFQFVLGVGGHRYRYEGSLADGVHLTDDSFDFAEQPDNPPWHNLRDPLDSSGDGIIAPQDALVIINELNLRGSRELRIPFPLRAISAPTIDAGVEWFWDVDGDRFIAPLDALRVINWLNAAQAFAGEGEAQWSLAPVADSESSSRPAPTNPATAQQGSSITSGASAWAKAVDDAVQQSSIDDPLDGILKRST